MDQLGNLMEGFAVAFTPQNLLFLVIGAILGTAVGAITVLILTPFIRRRQHRRDQARLDAELED